MRGQRRTSIRHALVLPLVAVLVLALGVSDALPLVSHWLGDTTAHACACATGPGHATCGCPICEHRADLRSRIATVRGKCGEDAATFGSALGFAVAPPAVFVAPGPSAPPLADRPAPRTPSSRFIQPPTPPPRALS